MLIALAALIQARLRDVSIAIDTVVVKQQTRLIQDKGDSWEVLKSFPTFFCAQSTGLLLYHWLTVVHTKILVSDKNNCHAYN